MFFSFEFLTKAYFTGPCNNKAEKEEEKENAVVVPLNKIFLFHQFLSNPNEKVRQEKKLEKKRIPFKKKTKINDIQYELQ